MLDQVLSRPSRAVAAGLFLLLGSTVSPVPATAQCDPSMDLCCEEYLPTPSMETCGDISSPRGQDVCDALTAFPVNGLFVEEGVFPGDVATDCTILETDALFSVFVLPDTQRYLQRNKNNTDNSNFACFRHYKCQIEGLLAAVEEYNAEFFTHVGDIVHGQQSLDPATAPFDNEQWYLATLGADPLRLPSSGEAPIPFSFSLGNHDYDEWPLMTGGSCGNPHLEEEVDCYREHFGAQSDSFLYNGFIPTWHVDQSPSGETSAQEFTLDDGRKILHVSLGYRGHDDEIEWLRELLDSRAPQPTILTTHSFTEPARTDRTRSFSSCDSQTGQCTNTTVLLPPHPSYRACENSTPEASGFNGGTDIGDKLVHLYPQIFLVISGHVSGASMARYSNFLDDPADATDYDWRTIERVVDYQAMLQGDDDTGQCGGDGWVDIVRFVDGTDPRIVFETESYSYNGDPSDLTDLSGCASCASFDLDALFSQLDENNRVVFHLPNDCTGGGCPSVEDTYIDADDPMTALSGESDVLVRQGGATVGDRHGLVRVDLSSLDGEVPPNWTLEKAVLTLTLEGQGTQGTNEPLLCDTKLYPMIAPWDGNTDWNNWGSDGIAANNVEAANTCEPTDPIEGCVDVEFPTCEELLHPDATQCLPTLGGSRTGPIRTTRSFDVTLHVDKWLLGSQANRGWAILPDGCEEGAELFFRSSEWPQIAEKPMLTLSFVPPAGS